MKKRKKEETKTLSEKILLWFKNPENILLFLILIAVTVVGIIDNNLEIIVIVYLIAFLYGRLLGFIFNLKDKIFNKKK